MNPPIRFRVTQARSRCTTGRFESGSGVGGHERALLVDCVGMGKEELATPALLIDLDVLEKNIRTMSEYYRGRKNAGIIPHQKGHRLPIIAKKQLDGGARGVSMTSLGLAEYYVQ